MKYEFLCPVQYITIKYEFLCPVLYITYSLNLLYRWVARKEVS